MSSTRPLPIIDSCEGCGACCRVVTLPPFRRIFNESGEEGWERLRWDRPDLLAQIITEDKGLRSRGEPSYGSPCLWYDSTTARCLHHELRPQACRDFAIGEQDCRDARRRSGVS